MAINIITKKLVFACIVLFLFSNFVIAFPQIAINTEKIFEEGDNIEFSYMLISQTNEIIKYTASVSCDNAPEPLLQLKQIELKRNEPYYDEYFYAQVDENFLTSECYALITIIEPYNFIKEQKFDVGAKSSFSFDVLLDKKVFTQGETISLDYSSDISNLEIDAKLTYPNKTIKQILLPSSILAEQIGTYSLDVLASKEGYKTVTKKEQFAAIYNNAKINYTSFEEESFDQKNLNFSEKAKETDLVNKLVKYIIYFLIGIILIIVLLEIIKKIKYRKK